MWTGPVDISGGPSVTLGSDFPGPGSLIWRPRPALVIASAVAAVAAVVWVVMTNSAMDRVAGAVIAVVLAALSVVGLRRRLVGGPRGLLVCGVSTRRIVPWSQVRTLASATSSRFGVTTTTIEIDLVDDDLIVLGRTDLGVDPDEVLAALREWSPRP